jgi:hypothetical protein
MNPLQLRLAAVRRRLRLVVTFRGTCWLLSLLFAVAVLAGLLDWQLHLPALVRAVLLAGGLVGTGFVAWRYLLRPLLARADDLTLALRVEAQHPPLTDVVASAVQFLEQPPESEQTGSPSLRRQAVQRALGLAEGFDFGRVVDARGVRIAGASFVGTAALAVTLLLLDPTLARTAILRLANPFGRHEWPKQTQLDVKARTRVARGEPFDIQATLRGVVPEKATVEYRFESGPPVEQLYEVRRREGAAAASFVARLEAARVLRSFQFQVRANDAASPWQEVAVLPPPQLIPLDGRPSPQVHLEYPAYTDLPPADAPDGAGSIECVAGTQVTLRAATDRPLERAWLEFPPELNNPLGVAAHLSGLSTASPLTVAAAQGLAASRTWRQIPARLEAEGRVLTLEFTARVGGSYVLHFEDESRLNSTRLLEVLVAADPPPTVNLERPSKTHDILEILPDAEIPLQVLAEDPVFAVRSVYLEYRLRRGTGEPPPARRLTLYDARVAEVLPTLGTSLAGLTPTLPPLRLRPQRVPAARRWSLRELGLKDGDTLTLQASADDFDDVTVGKPPGRSPEVELRVVNRTALDITLSEAQGRIQQELLRLQKQQQEALEKVVGAETQWRNQKGKLTPNTLDDLLQAEQLQEQIRARVGTKQEGLRAEVERVLQALRNNRLPRSGTNDRMETIRSELDRLAENELEKIEPRLTNARKQQEAAAKPADKQEKAPLSEARQHQEEVQNTLSALLKLLEPWSSTRELKGEARSILQEQRKLGDDTANLGKDKGVPSGVPPEKLDPKQRAELERLGELQKRLAQRTGQLLSKLGRVAEDRKGKDPETAQALKQAADEGEKNNVEGAMKEAAEGLRQNQLAKAGGKQAEGTKGMEKVVQALEERREQELDRLIKKLREAEKKLSDLAQRQEELHKKIKDAAQLPDAQQREQELRRLAREQEKLRQEAQEMVRELTRLRAGRAGQALNEAAGQMRQAGRQMTGGENPEDEQDEILDRLDDAQRQLQQAREEAEEELGREKLVKIADQVKGLRERQDSRVAEAARIHRELLQQQGWRRPLLSSLRELARAQNALGRETKGLSQEKLAKAAVFQHLLDRAAEAMEQAGERAQERLEQAQGRLDEAPEGEAKLDLAAEQAADDEIQQSQKDALRRLDQLLEALKPDTGMGPRPAPKEGDGQQPGGGGGGGGGGVGRAPGEGFPVVAQLKALRALQQDVNDRTERFARRHPDANKLTERQRAELEALKQEQQEVADLFQQLTAGEEPEGEKK